MANLTERLAALPPQKRHLLALRLQKQGIKLPPEYILPISKNQDTYPLSFSQERLWFFDQIAPGNSVYNLPVALRITGNLDIQILQQSVNNIIKRHEALRLTFVNEDGTAKQKLTQIDTVAIEQIDLTHSTPEQPNQTISHLTNEFAQTVFDLENSPLIAFRLLHVAPNQYIFLIVVHHIVADGWSAGVFVRELATIYAAYHAKQPIQLAELPIQFLDYIAWQRENITQEGIDFWESYLANAPTILELPTDYPRPVEQTFRGNTVTKTLPFSLQKELHALSKQEGITLFTLLIAAYKTLLFQYTGQQDFLIGTPVAGRTQRDTENIIGFFVNTIVLRAKIQADLTFRQFLSQVRNTILETFQHQNVPFEQVVEAIQPERSLGHTPIFQVAFVLQNAPMQALSLPNVTIEPVELNSGVAKFDLHLDVSVTENGLKVSAEYSADLFAQDSIERLISHYHQILKAFIVDLDQTIAAINMLDAEEKALILQYNETQRNYSQQPVHDLVYQQAQLSPNKIAIIYGQERITYGELLNKAHQLAHFLIAHGVKRGERIGVYMERYIELNTTLLGILIAGAAYVPLDLAYPLERIHYMVKDASLKFIITQTSLHNDLPLPKEQILFIDTLKDELQKHPITPTATPVSQNDLAYIIYTSGSTGQPKGVSVPHKGIVRLVDNTNYISLSHLDVVAQAANTSFDAATFEIWGALIHGASMVIVPRDTLLSPQAFERLLKKENVTTLFLTTALFNQISRVQPSAFSTLTTLLFGGEAVDPAYVHRILKHGAPKRLLHVYGPTENTTYSTWYHAKSVLENDMTVPIGYPIANDVAYVLNPHLQLVPHGVPGELYVGGDGLAWGYHQQPKLTAERFVPNPFSDVPGARLYRTGDLVRWHKGGIEFLGRVDHQVKIRGFRIELGEIEAALRAQHDIEEAAVIVQEFQPGDKRLIAYLGVKNEQQFDLQALHEVLQHKLPVYMIPNRIIPLTALPINANGKVDRHALLALELHDVEHEEDRLQEPPQTPTEILLSNIWQQVLHRDIVNRTDNFFALGGDSILAIQVANHAGQVGLDITTKHIFQYQTIMDLARFCDADLNLAFSREDKHKYLPLLPGVTQLLAFESSYLTQQYTMMLLQCRELLDLRLLEDAVWGLVSHHEVMTAQLMHRDDNSVILSDLVTIRSLLKIHDFEYAEDETTLNRYAHELSSHIDLNSGLPFAVGMMQHAETGHSLLFVGHLFVFDAVSWSILIEDLAAAYSQVKKGQTVQLMPQGISLSDVDEAFRLSVKDATISSRSAFTEFSETAVSSFSNCQKTTVSIGKTQTEKIFSQILNAYHIQIDELVTAIIAWAIGQAQQIKTVCIHIETRHIPKLSEKTGARLIGPIAATYPLTLDVPKFDPNNLPRFKEQLREQLNEGMTYTLAQIYSENQPEYHANMPTPSIRLRPFVFQPNNDLFTTIASFEPPVAGSSPYTLDICLRNQYGAIELCMQFDTRHFDQKTIDVISDNFKQIVSRLITHKHETHSTYTPSDFPMAQLDNNKLSHLLTNLKKIQN